MVRRVEKLPDKAKKGSIFERLISGKNGKRLVTFKATGKSGFGKWQILSNKKYKKKGD